MKLICQGKSVTQGTAVGTILTLTKSVLPRLDEINKSTILLLENSDPVYVLFIMNAGGAIIKRGGVLAHTCLLAIEMSLPCITQVGDDVSIDNGKAVILNAGEGTVYEYETT